MSSEDIPECLSNRNKALNVLVQDVLAYVEDASNSSIGMAKPPKSNEYNSKEPVMVLAAEEKGCDEAKCPIANTDGANCKDDAISTLMCDFWRILKDEPHFKLPQDLRSKVCVETCTGSSCSGKGKKSKSETSSTEGKTESLKSTPEKGFNVPITIEPTNHDCGVTTRTNVPLRKALSNLKDAASFEKSCAERMTELLTAQQSLTEQVQNLEEKERQGTLLLKKADCMWSCMEEQYKRQVEEKKETYKMLQNQKKEIDTNINKWRKTLKDLELKKKTLDTTSQEMAVKTIQKENDIKVLELEIESFKKRVARNADDLEAVQNSYNAKKKASEARVEKITDEMQKFQERVGDECQCKKDKEHEGAGYVKEARDDLQKICRCLLQKKLENEDLRAEKEALLQEIDLLKTTSETCSDRCKRREKNIVEETKRIDKEISDYQVKCKQCHKFTDSADLTGYCIDCPRCLIKRNCLIKGEECFSDHTKDCVCTRVKEKFLDNVFENMYSVLEKQAKTCPGKEVADCIFTCLERSRNGKLDEDTRKILQEFILSTVRNNLNLTIIGGAVKTRCEMDPEMYGQLMLCLKDVTVTKPVKADKATVSRKPPCKRWKDTSECNCPQGPKNCPCTKKAPKQPTEPGSCGQPDGREEEMEYSPTTLPGAGLWKRDPCEEGSCAVGMYGTNMRAAQCMLGPEALSKVRAHSKRPTPPTVPSVNFTNKKATRIIGNKAVKSCHTDDHEQSRLKMIEGVMGSYSEVSPIEEVRVADQHCEMCAARGKYSGCDCARLPTQNKKKELTIPYNYNLLIDKVLYTEPMENDLTKVTLLNYQVTTKEHIQLKSTLTGTPSDLHHIVVAPVLVDLEPVSNPQKGILNYKENTLEDMIKNMLNQNNSKEQLKKSFKHENNRSNLQYTEMTLTPSGKIASNLDIQTVELSISDPQLFSSIKTTSSELTFDAESVIDKTHVKRTRSETRTRLQKNMIKLLKDNLLNKKPNFISSKSIKFRDKFEKCIESEIPIDMNKQTKSFEKNMIDKVEIDPIFTKISTPSKIINENALNCVWSKTTSQDTAQANVNLPTSSKKNQDEEQFIPKTLDKKANSGSLSFLSKLSVIKTLLNNLQSDLKDRSEKRLDKGEINKYLTDKEEEKAYAAVDEEVKKEVSESSTNNEVPCSAVSMKSEHIPKLLESIYKSARLAESDDCCKYPSTSVSGGLLFDEMDRSDDIVAQQRCSHESKDFIADNYNGQKIGGVSSHFETYIERPIGQGQVWDALNYLPLQLPPFCANPILH